MEEGKGLSYFFLGLGIGVAVGIIFAPKSGEDTRNLLKSKADESKDYLKRRSTEIRDAANDALAKGKDAVSKQRDSWGQAIEAGKLAYHEAVSARGPAADAPAAEPGA